MAHKTLPPMRSLKKLAMWDGPFPMKSRRLVMAAERFGFGDDMITFLKLFPRDEVFRSRDEFLERCELLETIIFSEWKTPKESRLSPQD